MFDNHIVKKLLMVYDHLRFLLRYPEVLQLIQYLRITIKYYKYNNIMLKKKKKKIVQHFD